MLFGCLVQLNGAIAAEFCIDDPNFCDDKSLCAMAVSIDGNERPWHVTDFFLSYVKEAKERGLNCPEIMTDEVQFGADTEPNELEVGFTTKSEKSRKILQSILSSLGYYKSVVDGVYGRETATALRAYNREHLGDSDLTKSSNVNNLIFEVFNGEPASKIIIKEPIPSQNHGEIASKDNNSIGLLDILLLGLGAAAAANGGGEAFIEGFANGMSGSSSGSSQSTPSGSSSYSGSGSCSSDFSCGSGKKCVKKLGQATGVCMTSTNSYGVKTYSAPSTSSILPNNNGGGCRYNTDCPVGFRCDISYRACVK